MAKVDPKEGTKSFPKLSQADLEEMGGDVVILTIAGYEQRPMPDGGLVKEIRFAETDKPLRLNKTQVEYLIEAYASDDSDDWVEQLVPVEKVTKDGPDGKTYDVVWVCAPESWAHIFADAGVSAQLPAGCKARKVASVKAAGTEKARAKPKARAVKRSGRAKRR